MSELLRITPQIMDQQINTYLMNDQVNQANLVQQLSTGKAINQPSDNPPGIVEVMSQQSLATRTQQYINNANDGLAYSGIVNSTMQSIQQQLQTAKGLAVSISGAAQQNSQTELNAIAGQLNSIATTVLNLSNTQYLGMPIFGGTGTTAYDALGNYTGTNTVVQRTVAPGFQLPVSVIGSAAFGSGATGMYQTLTQMANDLQAGNVGAAENVDQSALDGIINQVENQGAVAGAQYQALQAAQQNATTMQNVFATQVSNVQDINMAQAITSLQEAQTTFQSALWSASQISQQSLMNYVP